VHSLHRQVLGHGLWADVLCLKTPGAQAFQNSGHRSEELGVVMERKPLRKACAKMPGFPTASRGNETLLADVLYLARFASVKSPQSFVAL